MKSYTFPVRFARRIPDPVTPGGERHIIICAVNEIPNDLPTDPNPRDQNTDRTIWRDIKKHLLNDEGTPNTFHLKNKGITLMADRVVKIDDFHYDVVFADGQGILDGGHTYRLIMENCKEIARRNSEDEDRSIDQFVKVEILTGFDSDLVAEIAGGLNTAIQVQEMSLANLKNEFDWIKDELAGEPYFSCIGFKENQEDVLYDARDIVVMLELFNIIDYPIGGSEFPIRAYSSKAAVLDSYRREPEKYERLRPILKDILALHDTISLEARDLHNERGGKAGKLAFVEQKKRGSFCFPFTGKKATYRLVRGALFPMLAAFRSMVEEDPATGNMRWHGGFAAALSVWRQIGGDLMQSTQQVSYELGRNVMALGKRVSHWQSLYLMVMMASMRGAAHSSAHEGSLLS